MEDGVHKYKHGRLPHWRFRGAIYFVTFNTIEDKLDDICREIILNAALYWHPHKYEVSCITVMPDHVHLICCLGEEEKKDQLSQIIRSVKQYSARQVNEKMGRRGSLWKQEFYDHIIRNDKELFNAVEYIWLNPYRAKLVSDPDDYPFSWFNDDW